MGEKRKRSSSRNIWIASAVIVSVFLCAGIFLVNILISDDGQKRKRQVQMVTLLKPPPPPKIEKPPEPEVKKEEEIVEPEPEETPPEQMEDQAQEDVPAGDDLGLDSEGVAGSDAFGLKAKKGGRALIGGGGNSLLRKYAWYTRIIQEEIRKELKKHLERNGGIPEGNFETRVKIVLDDQGTIVKHWIIGSSGNHKMDDAVKQALRFNRISELPPEGMPRAMSLEISSQG
jgi:outer membrane biosynthesis protein TonB